MRAFGLDPGCWASGQPTDDLVQVHQERQGNREDHQEHQGHQDHQDQEETEDTGSIARDPLAETLVPAGTTPAAGRACQKDRDHLDLRGLDWDHRGHQELDVHPILPCEEGSSHNQVRLEEAAAGSERRAGLGARWDRDLVEGLEDHQVGQERRCQAEGEPE